MSIISDLDVELSWEEPLMNGDIKRFWYKLKRLKNVLIEWNKKTFGNVFEDLKIAEEKVLWHERKWEQSGDLVDREALSKVKAEQLQLMAREEMYYEQKTGMEWTQNGDRNTAGFHNFVKKRRKQNEIHGIQVGNEWITDKKMIEESAVKHFTELLCEEVTMTRNEDLMDCIPRVVTPDDNLLLLAIPTEAEVRSVVMLMSSNSAAGVDGFNAHFYKHCWHIIKVDLVIAVQAFFQGEMIPKGAHSTAISLVPKVQLPKSWSQFRPISLSTVFSKIITKVLNNRLATILPKIVAEEQGGFIPGRLIQNNILLTQEMVHCIDKNIRGGNMIIKLDMSKAFDRISWDFICLILEKQGFNELWINRVMHCISSTWSSIMINGELKGYFHPLKGVKQGDPLSPSLFVLAEDYLIRGLNSVISNQSMAYHTGVSLRVNCAAYADDFLIFCNGSKTTLGKVTRFLAHYEKVSGQAINKEKSKFIISSKSSQSRGNHISRISGFSRTKLPFLYLGIQIYKGRKQVFLFDDMIDRMSAKIQEWNGKKLSFGGRLTLIQSVLMSLPIYHLQCMVMPESVIERIEKLLNQFLWCNNEGVGIKWTSMENASLPYNEGGLNIRRLEDLQNTFSMKLWYDFRCQKSIWSQFMLLKYCSRFGPLEVHAKVIDSKVWKRMIKIRDMAEPQIARVQDHGEVKKLWKLSEDGGFNTAMTWEYIRHEGPVSSIFGKLWSTINPRKCSFLTWRLLHDWLPVDHMLRRKGFIIVSRCQHCDAFETIQHVFMVCDIAWRVWAFFSLIFNVHINRHMNIRQVIQFWFSSTASNVHMRLLLPTLICWSIWEARNRKKHNGVNASSEGIIARVTNFIFRLILCEVIQWKHWTGDHKVMKSLQCYLHPPRPKRPEFLSWSPPPQQFLKLNVDGSSCKATGISGSGALLRKSNGDAVWAKCAVQGRCTPILAEFLALVEGLKMCCSHQNFNIIVESDSKVMVEMIGNGSVPWNLRLLIGNIHRLLSACKGSLNHVYRECNQGADFLAKLAVEMGHERTFYSHSFPPKLRAIIELEREGVGYIRL